MKKEFKPKKTDFPTTTPDEREWMCNPRAFNQFYLRRLCADGLHRTPQTMRIVDHSANRHLVQHSISGDVFVESWPRLFRIAEAARRTGKGVGSWRGRGVDIGGYWVRHVYRNGNVRVGCQLLQYWEIVRIMFAVELLGVKP